MNIVKGVSRIKGMKRILSISRVLMRHGLGNLTDSFTKPDANASRENTDTEVSPGIPSPARIRRAFEELGPSFIKLGQLMSTRADILPPRYIDELKKLQDRVPAIPFAEIQTVIETELKQPLQEIFKEWNSEAIAAASIAQVHSARLFSGEKTVIKVVRPGIRKVIAQDIRLMYFIARKLEGVSEAARNVGAINIVSEFERTIYNELDMFIEAGNLDRFARNFKDSTEVQIPKVFWKLTSKSVLTMEYIEGVKMDQVDAIRKMGIDTGEVARVGLRAFSRQLMEFGFFHADPHPANTIVMPNGRVGIIDFGITGYLDDMMMHHVAHLLLGFAEHDYGMVMEALQDVGIIREDMKDIVMFQSDLKDACETFYGRNLNTITVRDVYNRVMELILKYHLKLPRNLLLLMKTLIQTEALGKILASDASILEVCKPYALAFLEKRYKPRHFFSSMVKDARDMGDYLKSAPKWLNDILKHMATGKQRIELHHTGFERLDTRLEKGINRLTVGIIIAASTIAGSLVLNSSQKVLEFPVALFGHQTLSITGVLGLAGYTIATVLGIWLIRSIFRSGKM